jgi:hypothetical protein
LSPKKGDLVLRPLAVADGHRHYVLVKAVSKRRVAGPFLTLGDAVIAAKAVAHLRRVNVWHEQVDDRGRVMGNLLALFSVKDVAGN